MDYYVTLRLENLKEISDFTVKLRSFSFFSTSFERNYAKIIPNLLDSLAK